METLRSSTRGCAQPFPTPIQAGKRTTSQLGLIKSSAVSELLDKSRVWRAGFDQPSLKGSNIKTTEVPIKQNLSQTYAHRGVGGWNWCCTGCETGERICYQEFVIRSLLSGGCYQGFVIRSFP